MLINFQCRQCRVVFDSEVGEITMPADADRPQFEHPIGCPRCGPRSLDEVWLTERGQSQLTAAVLSP
jgi:rubredoxin